MSEPQGGVPEGVPCLIRRAEERDLASIRCVSLAVGQPEEDSGADPRYVRMLLDEAAVRVAVSAEAAVIGWAAVRVTPLGELLTDLFVEPTSQHRGVGRRLLEALWGEAVRVRPRLTFSSLHPNALPLYARAGLRPLWPLLYLCGDAGRLPRGDARAERVSAAAAAEGERRLTGSGRTDDYRYWSGSPSGTGLLVRIGERLVAAGAGDAARLSHLTCPSPGDAVAAACAALSVLGGSSTSVCLPGPHPALQVLLEHGWRIEEHDLAMATADLELPTAWVYSPGAA